MRLTMPSKSTSFRLRTILRSTFTFALSSSTRTASSFSIAAASIHSNIKGKDTTSLNLHSSIPFIQGGSLTSTKLQKSIKTMTSTTTQATVSAESETATPSKNLSSGELLAALRTEMKKCGVDAYVVPSDDPHLSEYVSEAYRRRAFVTGFDGSAGTALITEDSAYLWTDSRYYNQANLQLDSDHWELMKSGERTTPTIPKYLAELAEKKYNQTSTTFRVGLDPYVHSASFAKDVDSAFETAAGDNSIDATVGEIDTLDAHGNLVDTVWGESRPSVPTSPFRPHPIEYSGVSVSEKIERIRAEMKVNGATLCVFSTLDDIAYLFNVRAIGDVFSCPVGIAYGTITLDGDVTLYCSDKKVKSEAVKAHLAEAGVVVAPYENVVSDIQKHCESEGKSKVWLDKSRCNFAISRVIPSKSLVDKQNAVTPMKACKNEVELEGMRKAHIVDGAAMAHAIAKLEDLVVNQSKKVSEVEVDLIITGERAKQPGFLEVSFPTIAGVGSNGAIIHYGAEENELMKYLDTTQPILIDSGGQYEYGTTDVTRTWHFGEATDEFKEAYTRVLKGNIGVDSMIWPENTPGFVLDVFARKSLWESGKDYGHGTGHGVGAALNVHEGPMSISARWKNAEVLKEGMVLSNEPGYYEDGNFGIRIENLLEINVVPEITGAKDFFKFQKLTMIPIQKNLIQIDLMTETELDWLDDYHASVWEKVSPLLDDGCPAKIWLEKSCSKIERS